MAMDDQTHQSNPRSVFNVYIINRKDLVLLKPGHARKDYFLGLTGIVDELSIMAGTLNYQLGWSSRKH